jgi:spore maturation protein CgeB
MLNKIAGYKIGINIHGGVAEEYAANIRMFEVTGAGSCLVTDHKTNIHDLFEPDKEIVTYRSTEECIEKIKWLLNNPSTLQEIARAGQERTFKEHTVENRVGYLDEIIRQHL